MAASGVDGSLTRFPRPIDASYEDVSLVSRLREFVAATPGSPAIVRDGHVVSYAELDSRSDVLAGRLLRAVGPGTEPVVTALGHDELGLIALVAAMKAGRPVAQLDLLQPAARLATMVELAAPAIIVTDASHQVVIPALNGRSSREIPVVRIGAADEIPAPAGPPADPVTVAAAPTAGSDLAAVFFTSGSSGQPKGVRWAHRMIMCEAWTGAAVMGLGPADRIGLVLPYSFSAGLSVVAWGLATGAALHLFDPRVRGAAALLDWLAAERITTLHTTPTMLRAMVRAMPDGAVLDTPRLVSTCSEPLAGTELASLRRHLTPSATYVNWTGASEAGTIAFNVIAGSDPLPTDGPLPAGPPVEPKTVEIRGEDGRAVAAGAAGEVVIVSRFLADGYLRADGRTAARFGRTDAGERTYRTGDRGRLGPGGSLELLGRLDTAVAVGGHLVEPDEIAHVLTQLPGVREAVVVGHRAGRAATRLVAYVGVGALAAGATGATAVGSAVDPGLGAGSGRGVPSPVTLRRHLRERLPGWMVPATVIVLAELPRTERGKIDRAALPEPAPRPRAAHAPPRSDREAAVLAIWERAFGLTDIGIFDDFLSLGGDAEVAREIVRGADALPGRRMSTADVAEAPNVAAFAARLTGVAGVDDGPPASGERANEARPTCVTLRPADRSSPADGAGLADAAGLPATDGLDEAPLFCVTDIGQLAIELLPLARLLRGPGAVYGFQASGIERRGAPDLTVEAHARRHLGDLRAIQPAGPYRLLGVGFGGLVAYEMAQRLVSAGETVAELALVAVDPPDPVARAAAAAGPATRLGAAALAALMPAEAAGARGYLRRTAALSLAGLVSYGRDEHVGAFAERGVIATSLYRMLRYGGPVVLLGPGGSAAPDALVPTGLAPAEDAPAGRPDVPFAWRDLLIGPVAVEWLPGGADLIEREPLVTALATVLNRRRREAGAHRPASELGAAARCRRPGAGPEQPAL